MEKQDVAYNYGLYAQRLSYIIYTYIYWIIIEMQKYMKYSNLHSKVKVL